MYVNLLEEYKKIIINNKLNEANLKKLSTKTSSETPKIDKKAKQMIDDVRYFGLSKDGTLNFKVKSQTRAGKYHFSYIEVGDIIKFGDVFEEGRNFDITDFTRLLNMNGFRVHCNDESFLYYAFQYIATLGDYEINPETRAPKRNNVLLAGSLCKHLQAVIYNLFQNQKMRDAITKDINNYLRMIEGLDYEDYQQANYAKQIQQQNRAVKWKNKPSDYMNDYFARQAKTHQFLDDRDIKKSLKKEMNKYLKANPTSEVDDFLRSYFQMTQKAFAEDMRIPENSIDDYFNELGFDKKKDSLLNPPEKEPTNKDIDNILTGKTEVVDDIDIEDDDDETGGLLSKSVMTNDSELPSATARKTKILLKEGVIKTVERTNKSSARRFNNKSINYKESENAVQNALNDILTIKEELYEEYLVLHREGVKRAFSKLCAYLNKEETDLSRFVFDNYDSILEVINKHDSTKEEDFIWEEYRKHFYPTNEEDSLCTEGFKNAVTEHITKEPHHWEYWCTNNPDGTWVINENLIKDTKPVSYMTSNIERICDWCSMSMLFGTRLKDWLDNNDEQMVLPEDYQDFNDALVDIIIENNIDVAEDINLAYTKLQTYNNKIGQKRLTESIDEAIREDVDRSNLWVHTFGGMGSKMPILGKGFYLYHVNSVSKSKHRDASKGNNKYYRLKNSDNILYMDTEDSVVPFTDEQIDILMENLKLNKIRLTEEEIRNEKGQVILRKLSELFRDGINVLMKEMKIQGILVLEMKNAYHGETIMHELISYDNNNLQEVTEEVL